MAKKEEADDLDVGEDKGKSKKKLILFGGIGALVLLLGTGAALYFMGVFSGEHHEVAEGEAAEPAEEVHPVAIYHALEPAFVVNFEGNSKHRFLQVDVQVMSREQGAIDAVQQHAPMIRNNLLMLFGAQDSSVLKTREGKEKLRSDVLAELQRVLSEETGKPGVEQVFFTSFVMQ